MTEIYRGDIYYIMPFYTVTGSEQRAGRPGVVVSNDINNRHSPNVEIVFLTSQEKKPLPTHVPVMCRVPSTALCENIQTVSKERLSTFIKSCTTKELKNIDNALLVSLGINSPFPVGGGGWMKTRRRNRCSGRDGRKGSDFRLFRRRNTIRSGCRNARPCDGKTAEQVRFFRGC